MTQSTAAAATAQRLIFSCSLMSLFKIIILLSKRLMDFRSSGAHASPLPMPSHPGNADEPKICHRPGTHSHCQGGRAMGSGEERDEQYDTLIPRTSTTGLPAPSWRSQGMRGISSTTAATDALESSSSSSPSFSPSSSSTSAPTA